MSFSSKNDAESFINFIKIPFLDPKRAKLVKIVVRNVYGNLTESDGISKTCPGGPIWAHMGPYMGTYEPIYGPIRAHMGPNPDRAPTRTGPQPGLGPNPDWAPHGLIILGKCAESPQRRTGGRAGARPRNHRKSCTFIDCKLCLGLLVYFVNF